jgi:hypothetical protein
MIHEIDVRAVLPAIHVPTLVIQRLSDRITPPCHGRYLASHIAGARYFEQPGDHSLRFAASGDNDAPYAAGRVAAVRGDRVRDRAGCVPHRPHLAGPGPHRPHSPARPGRGACLTGPSSGAEATQAPFPALDKGSDPALEVGPDGGDAVVQVGQGAGVVDHQVGHG